MIAKYLMLIKNSSDSLLKWSSSQSIFEFFYSMEMLSYISISYAQKYPFLFSYRHSIQLHKGKIKLANSEMNLNIFQFFFKNIKKVLKHDNPSTFYLIEYIDMYRFRFVSYSFFMIIIHLSFRSYVEYQKWKSFPYTLNNYINHCGQKHNRFFLNLISRQYIFNKLIR